MEYLQYTTISLSSSFFILVLNLIINGIPSILETYKVLSQEVVFVLNLIINGIPSILQVFNWYD